MAEDRITIPEWLDKSFIQTALRRGMKNPFLEIVEYKLAPATAVGENYASQMLRASSIVKKQKNGKEENLGFIIKFPPKGQTADYMKSFEAFEKEGKMYCDIIPEMQALLSKAYPDDESITATGYGYENEVLFMEDLKESGFEKSDRFRGSDWPQIMLVLNALAKYHASSYVLIQNKPEIKNFYNDTIWDPERNTFKESIMKNVFEGLACLVETWEDSPEKERYWSKLKKLAATSLEKTQQIYTRDDNDLNVLLHGDSWINNFMFMYDEDRKPLAVKMVDLQFITVGTPVLDVIHYIFSSASDEVRIGDPDAYLGYYHECFMKTLKNLDFKLEESFTLQDLRNAFFRRLFYGVTVLCFLFPFNLQPQDEVLELEDVMQEGTNKMYKNKALTTAIKRTFPYFEKHGVL